MKSALVVFGLCLVAIVALAMWQGKLDAGLRASLRSAIGIGPVLVLAVFIMGFTEVLLPQGWVEHWLSDASGPRGLLVAWLAGVLTPGGSVLGIPLAAGLLKTGASPAVVVTYLTSMATLSLIRMPMEVSLYGLRLTALRVASCALLPFVAGGLTRLITGGR